MERIALADEYFDLVNNGIKTSTIRYKRRNYNIGECKFYSDTTDKTTIVKIKEIQYKIMSDLTEQDAIQDGFRSLAELKGALLRFYPNATDSDEITKVIFSK
jgi:hypothetical protein